MSSRSTRAIAFATACALFLTSFLPGCGSSSERAPAEASQALQPFLSLQGELAIAGGTAHIPVMEEAQKRIMTANPKISISVAGGGSGQGVKQVTAGLVHIGNTGRVLTEAEIAAGGLKSFPFAIDGVAVIVHPDNPVRNLTTQQVKDLFAGQVTGWKSVDGSDSAVHVFTREEGSGTRSTFWEVLLGKGDITPSANVVESNGSMKTAVAGDPGAIGYLSIGHLDDSIAAVSIDGVAPTQENAASGKYEVTRGLYMNTKGEPTGLTKAFIDYILGPEGAKIVEANNYIVPAKR